MTWMKRTGYYTTKKIGGYDSKFEAGYADELVLRQKVGDIKSFQSHIAIPLAVNGYKICDYYIDFVVHHNDGTTEYVETKGYPTPVWKLKWRIFLAMFEDDESKKITLVMQGKQKPYKPRKARKL